MISKIKNNYLLFIIAIIWAIIFIFTIQLKCSYTYGGDEGSYLIAAKKLYLELKIDDERPLVISAINGFPLLFELHESYIFKWIVIVNLVCWFFTLVLINNIVTKKSNSKFGFYTSLIFVFSASNLAITHELLSESVFIFLLVLSVYLIDKYILTLNISYLTGTIALLLFAILVKPLSIGLVFIILVIYFKKIKAIFMNKLSFLILIGLSLIFIQMYSLKKEFGNYTISYIGSLTYYSYLGTRADCFKNNIEFEQGKSKRYQDFIKLSRFEQKKTASDDLKNQIINNPINLIKAYLVNIYSNSTKGSATIHECKNRNNTSYFDTFRFIFKAISKLQNIIFTILGIVISLNCIFHWRKQLLFFKIVVCFIIYLFLTSAISSDQGDRFHLLLYPLIILLLLNNKSIISKLENKF